MPRKEAIDQNNLRNDKYLETNPLCVCKGC